MIVLNRKTSAILAILVFMSISAIIVKLRSINDRLNDLDSSVDAAIEKTEGLENSLEEKDAEIEKLRSNIDDLEFQRH